MSRLLSQKVRYKRYQKGKDFTNLAMGNKLECTCKVALFCWFYVNLNISSGFLHFTRT